MQEASDLRFRILLTSDWRLTEVCGGCTQVPESHFETLSNAAYRAVENLIDFAIAEQVDAVVIAGNTLDPSNASPADYSFLQKQLARLHTNSIHVIWNWSYSDKRHDWPRCFRWPETTHCFNSNTPKTIQLSLGNAQSIHFVGLANDSRDEIKAEWFEGIQANGLLFGVGYGRMIYGQESNSPSFPWLLGGQPYRYRDASESMFEIYSGSPQGRNLEQTGPHGAALLEFDTTGEYETYFVNLSPVEYTRLHIDANAETLSELNKEIMEVIESSVYDDSLLTIYTLEIKSNSTIVHVLNSLSEYHAVLDQLQRQINRIVPSVIVASIELEGAFEHNGSASQEVLGEFLFEISRLRKAGWQDLDLTNFLPLNIDTTWATLEDDLIGLTVLKDCETLGIHLLRPDPGEAA